MSDCRSEAGRLLFQLLGPATEKLLSPSRVFVGVSGAKLGASGVRDQLAVVDQVRWSWSSQRLVDDNGHISCVFDELRRSRLEAVHAAMSVTHPARRSTASAASSTDVVKQTWQSSAYWCSRRLWQAMTLFKSAVYRTKSRGPRTDPCRTPNWRMGDSWRQMTDDRQTDERTMKYIANVNSRSRSLKIQSPE